MIPLNDPDIRRRTTGYVVYALLAANVLVAAFQMLMLTTAQEIAFTYHFGIVPRELTGVAELNPVRLGPAGPVLDIASPIPPWATVFTSMFLHAGLLHLGGNMLFLWVFGRNIEDRFGHLKFLGAYLLAGVAAVWAQVYIDPESQVPMVGASGAIAGILGAYIVLFPRSRVHTLLTIGIIFHMRLPAIVLLGGWVLIQVFLGLTDTGGGVAYFAHIGGFAAGLAFGFLYRLFRGSAGPPNRRPPQYWRGRPI
ncbi:MAG: rhomboid family intramembrane serine protease [Dehalococcoidia bacterium]